MKIINYCFLVNSCDFVVILENVFQCFMEALIDQYCQSLNYLCATFLYSPLVIISHSKSIEHC